MDSRLSRFLGNVQKAPIEKMGANNLSVEVPDLGGSLVSIVLVLKSAFVTSPVRDKLPSSLLGTRMSCKLLISSEG